MAESNESFEENLKKLESIALELERSDLSLDEAIKNFENGIKLSKECTKKLDEAEKKINILIENDNGEYEEEKFDLE